MKAVRAALAAQIEEEPPPEIADHLAGSGGVREGGVGGELQARSRLPPVEACRARRVERIALLVEPDPRQVGALAGHPERRLGPAAHAAGAGDYREPS
jgi:hypothetical protein